MSSSGQINLRGHVPVLDGLRGVAILMVLIVHFYQRELFTDSRIAAAIMSRIVSPGRWGVELFFVLSGFLITGILLDSKKTQGGLFNFYMRRFLRIFPLYYISLAVVLLVLPMFITFDAGAQRIASSQVWLWTYLANLPPVAGLWDESNQFLLGHFWSLCVEEHFYIFWPLIVYLVSNRGLFVACLATIGVGIAARMGAEYWSSSPASIFHWATLQKLDGLAVGALIALMMRDERFARFLPRGQTFKLGFVVLLVAFIGLQLIPRQMSVASVRIFGETAVVVFFGFLLWGTILSHASGSPSRILRAKWLIILGKYSYGLYVIHGILRPAVARMFDFTDLPRTMGLPFLYLIAYYLLAIGVSFGLAYVSYHLIERRFLAMKRYFEYRESRQAATGALANATETKLQPAPIEKR